MVFENCNEPLTSTEMGKLWATYTGNTMSQCVLTYYLQHLEDQDIKKVVNYALTISNSFVENIKGIFIQEGFPLPVGFSSEDVNLDAPRLYFDEFYLYYLRYASKAGLSIYSIAVSLASRPDIREFFINALNSTVILITQVNDLLYSKGLITKPAQIPIPEKVDFIKKQSFLSGFFGHIRSLHALEITHLYDNIDNNVTSKALLIGFRQVAQMDKIREYFKRGINITGKHVETASSYLNNDNLPSPSLLDHLVSTSTTSPFSDKLMLYHKIDMFSMKIRTYANGASLNGRRDIGAMYGRFLMEVGLYVEDGANILIDNGWMEQPPKAADRENLSAK